MPIAAYSTTPEAMTIVNLNTQEELKAQFNPEEVQENIGATYAKQAVPGLSHTVKQFVHTNDTAIAFTLMWSSHGGPAAHAYANYARRFLQAAHFPRRVAGSIARGGPPRLLFVWPQMYSLTSVMMTCQFNYKAFNFKGAPIIFSAQVALEEIRDGFLSSEDVMEAGAFRPAGTPPLASGAR